MFSSQSASSSTKRARPGSPAWQLRRRSIALTLLAVDLVTLLAAIHIARPDWVMAGPLVLMVIVLFAGGHLYRSRARLTVLDDLPSLLGRVLVAGTLVTSLDLLTDGNQGREALASAVVFSFLIIPMRALAYAVVRRARRLGRLTTSTLIVGGGELGGQLASTLQSRPEYGLRPVGHLASEPAPVGEGVPWCGPIEQLSAVVAESDADAVVIVADALPEGELVTALRHCRALTCEVFLLPRLFALAGVGPGVELVWGLPLIRVTSRIARRAPLLRRIVWNPSRPLPRGAGSNPVAEWRVARSPSQDTRRDGPIGASSGQEPTREERAARDGEAVAGEG